MYIGCCRFYSIHSVCRCDAELRITASHATVLVSILGRVDILNFSMGLELGGIVPNLPGINPYPSTVLLLMKTHIDSDSFFGWVLFQI